MIKKEITAITATTNEPLPTVPAKLLALKSVNANMVSKNDFRWPESGQVEAPDWEATKECGNGLHAFAWGSGDGSLANWDEGARWLVIDVDIEAGMVELWGSIKFRRGTVVHCGDRISATQYLLSQNPGLKGIIGASSVCGDGGAATAGDYGTATAGYRGTAIVGDHGTAIAGHRGAATAGRRGTATVGDGGTATVGNGGTAIAGDHGTATAGYCGIATAGDHGTATAGEHGTVAAGCDGSIVIRYYDFEKSRYRIACADVGEDGIEPGVTYRVVDGKFQRADQ